jgi:hypothetical protein
MMSVEQFLPEAKKLINDNILNIVREKGPKVALSKIYTMFPFYIRALVKEDTFVNFCLFHQDKIFGPKVPGKQAAKKSAKKSPAKKAPVKAPKKKVAKKSSKKK